MFAIWILSFAINLLGVLAQSLEWWSFYFYYRYVRLYIFWILPVILIICMYLRLFLQMLRNTSRAIKTISVKVEENEAKTLEKNLGEKARQMTRSIQVIVICLVICFLPYIGWINYYYINFPSRYNHYKVFSYEVRKYL